MSNSISPRPTLEQVVAMLNFLEKHPNLALGKMKGGVEARAESKKLWLQLSRVLNAMTGPTRPTKSWIKFWSDKKSNVKIKVHSAGGDPSSLLSNIERRIWDLFLSEDKIETKRKPSSELGQHFPHDNIPDEINEDMDTNNADIEFEEQPVLDYEERNIAIMERLTDAMEEQAKALAQIAQANEANAQAMNRLAETTHIQARAIERLANSFAAVGGSAPDVRDVIVDMDNTVKRFYSSMHLRL